MVDTLLRDVRSEPLSLPEEGFSLSFSGYGRPESVLKAQSIIEKSIICVWMRRRAVTYGELDREVSTSTPEVDFFKDNTPKFGR